MANLNPNKHDRQSLYRWKANAAIKPRAIKLVWIAEAEQGRVAEGKPTANG